MLSGPYSLLATVLLPYVSADHAKARAKRKVTIIDVLFGCGHKRTSFPRTTRPNACRGVIERAQTYVVCLDCGKEFGYDWKDMKILGPLRTVKDKAAWRKGVAEWTVPIISFISFILALVGLMGKKKEAA